MLVMSLLLFKKYPPGKFMYGNFFNHIIIADLNVRPTVEKGMARFNCYLPALIHILYISY